MENKKVNAKILYANENDFLVKLPFLEVPVMMGYEFFKKRVIDGYFKFKR